MFSSTKQTACVSIFVLGGVAADIFEDLRKCSTVCGGEEVVDGSVS